jgi:GNAT superfamily N-acetyltransferase
VAHQGLSDHAGIRVRDAVVSEVGALVALQRRASLVWEDTRSQLLAHPEAIDLPEAQVRHGMVRVAVRLGDPGDRVVGFSAVLPVEAGYCELDGLFVEPDEWRTGVGRRLVQDAAGRAVAAGAVRLTVTANRNALGFYEGLGFVAGEVVATRFAPGLRMSLDLGEIGGPRGERNGP